jgi:hypothetical protein
MFEFLPGGGQRRPQHGFAGDDDHLEPRRQVEVSEQLPDPAFGEISFNCAADFLAGGDADSGAAGAGLADAHTHQLPVPLDAVLEHPGELAPAAQPGATRKRVGHGRQPAA